MAGWFKVSAIEKTTKDPGSILANIFKDYKLNSISSKLIKSFIAKLQNNVGNLLCDPLQCFISIL